MSVEVRIPKEITEYQEKIMFGLSIRQLICTVIAIVISVPSYIILMNKIGQELTGYIVIIEVAPLIAIGYLKPKGLKFEKVLLMFLKHQLGKSKRYYKTLVQVDIVDILDGGNENDIQKKSSKKSIGRKSEKEREYKSFEPSKKDRKRKFKEVKKQIKRAKRDFRQRKKNR